MTRDSDTRREGDDVARSKQVHRARVVVPNPNGMHARPSHALVSLALGYEADLRIRCGEREVNGKSILQLMTLGAAQGSVLELAAQGRDSADLVAALVALVERGFGDSS